jgi:uncharacterized protein YhaN
MSRLYAPSQRLRLIAKSMVVVLAIASCTTTSAKPENEALLSNEERTLRAEDKRFKTGIVVGCLGGAAIGFIVSKAKKMSTAGTIKATAIATAAGCAAGAAAGYYVNSRNKDFANEQQASRSLIEAADADIARYKKSNSNADKLVRQQRAKVANLNDRYKRKELTAAGYRKQVASAENNKILFEKKVNEANDNIKLMNSDIKQLKGAGKNTSELERKRQQLVAQRNKLEEKVDLLAATYDNMPPEVRPVTS